MHLVSLGREFKSIKSSCIRCIHSEAARIELFILSLHTFIFLTERKVKSGFIFQRGLGNNYAYVCDVCSSLFSFRDIETAMDFDRIQQSLPRYSFTKKKKRGVCEIKACTFYETLLVVLANTLHLCPTSTIIIYMS